MGKYTVRQIAEDKELWNTYANPNGEPDDDMTTADKMKMIVDLWPESIDEYDDEAKAILKKRNQ